MALSPQITAPQGQATAVGEGTDLDVSGSSVTTLGAGTNLALSAAFTNVVFNWPAEAITASQLLAIPVYNSANTIEVSQAYSFAIALGRIENPRLISWKFSLDDHEFWVINLGTDKTLLYDTLTGQWTQWLRGDSGDWGLSCGMNWQASGAMAQNFGSNVITGSNSTGNLWVLNPEQGYDGPASTEDLVTKYPFIRRATAQIISRGRNFIPVYDVFLTASPDRPSYELAPVNLIYSDDGGMTYIDAGSIPVETNNYNQNYVWRSLGRIQAPGRLFYIEDDGAFARIDSLDVNTVMGE